MVTRETTDERTNQSTNEWACTAGIGQPEPEIRNFLRVVEGEMGLRPDNCELADRRASKMATPRPRAIR
jgi:hypothetical protein